MKNGAVQTVLGWNHEEDFQCTAWKRFSFAQDGWWFECENKDIKSKTNIRPKLALEKVLNNSMWFNFCLDVVFSDEEQEQWNAKQGMICDEFVNIEFPEMIIERVESFEEVK